MGHPFWMWATRAFPEWRFAFAFAHSGRVVPLRRRAFPGNPYNEWEKLKEAPQL